MGFYRKLIPSLLKFLFDLGMPLRSRLMALLVPDGFYKEGEFKLIKKIWFDIHMHLDLSFYIEKYLYFYDVYEPEVISFLTACVDDKKNCLDLGANIGLHSIVMARKTRKQVIAYEANPRIVQRLRNNVSLNACDNVSIYDRAIALSSGDVRFHVPKTNAHSMDGSITSRNPSIESEVVTVKADGIVDIVRQFDPLGLIKIDVEGLELALIRASLPLLSRQQTTILFEYNRVTWMQEELDPKKLVDYFRGYGYALFEIKEAFYKSRKPAFNLLSFPCQDHFLINIVALHTAGSLFKDLVAEKRIRMPETK